MSIWELFLIAAGLSMDAFAVSISDGMVIKEKKTGVFAALMFGVFQGIMPIIGYFLGYGFAELVNLYDHIIALGALGFIGGKMAVESVMELKNGGSGETAVIKEPSAAAILLQAGATSIDALIVGVSFAAIGVRIFPAAAFIALVTFFICLLGVLGGRKFGSLFGAKASLAGGLILIAIGVKTFLQHTL